MKPARGLARCKSRWQGTTQRNPRPRALRGNEAAAPQRLMTSHAARSGGAPLAARRLRGPTPGGSTLTELLPRPPNDEASDVRLGRENAGGWIQRRSILRAEELDLNAGTLAGSFST